MGWDGKGKKLTREKRTGRGGFKGKDFRRGREKFKVRGRKDKVVKEKREGKGR